MGMIGNAPYNGIVGAGQLGADAPVGVSDKTNTSTGAFDVPAGTTAQRPSTPSTGMIRYNSDTGYMETYTASGWAAVATPPSVTTVSPTTYNGEQGTAFTINGSFFDTGATVKFVTTQGVEYTAASVSFINSAQLTATTPQDFSVANEPLSVKVINASGLSTTLSAAIDCGGVPAWTTAAGQLASVYEYTAGASVTLLATDPDAGASVTYAVTSGALPSGLSLNASTGVISGDIAAVSSQTTTNFTVTASDNAGNQTQRAFSIVTKPELSLAIFGSAFDGQGTAANGMTLTISNALDQSTSGQSGWSGGTYQNLSTALAGFPTSRTINDSNTLCAILLTKPARVYMIRSTAWDPVSTSGWTLYDSVQYIPAASPNCQTFYKDFPAGTHYLDNDSAMYIANGSVLPTVLCGKPNIGRLTGSSWFSSGYYGVDTLYQFAQGMHIRAWDWVTGSTAAGGRIWFFVMERHATNTAQFFLRAGWLFVDPNPGNGFRRTLRTEDATSTIGAVDATTKKYVVPSANHLASGQYFLGWYSGDPNGGTQINNALHVTYDQAQAPANGGGTVHYNPIDTIPSNGLSITFDNLNTGRGMIMAAHGFN